MEKAEETVGWHVVDCTFALPQQLGELINEAERKIAVVCRDAGCALPILDPHWLWCFPGVEKAALALEAKAEKKLKRQKNEPISCSVYRDGLWQQQEPRNLFVIFRITRKGLRDEKAEG